MQYDPTQERDRYRVDEVLLVLGSMPTSHAGIGNGVSAWKSADQKTAASSTARVALAVDGELTWRAPVKSENLLGLLVETRNEGARGVFAERVSIVVH